MTTLEDPGFLTTREVAALLRVKQRRVYDLAASGEIPHTKATGKLLFQRADIDAWLSAQQAPRPPGQPQAPVGVTRPEVIAGSHDPLLDWALRASGARIANLFDSSLDGLEEVATGRAAACGLHLLDAATGEWNIGPVATRLPRDFVLISWARRARGLLLAPGREVKSLAALAGRRLVCRQPGAGAQIHLESELARAGLALTDFACLPEPARSEAEAAATIATGQADLASGLATMARDYKLGFLPMATERYDIAIDRRFYFEPGWQMLMDFTRTAAFKEKADSLGGYDIFELGTPRWNGA